MTVAVVLHLVPDRVLKSCDSCRARNVDEGDVIQDVYERAIYGSEEFLEVFVCHDGEVRVRVLESQVAHAGSVSQFPTISPVPSSGGTE